MELLPGYSDVFDVMFDSVKIEGLPVEAEEDSDEMDSDFSDDEQDEDGLGDDEYLPTNHGVPCDQCVWFVAKEPTAATNHRLKLQEMVISPSRYELSLVDIVHIRSCLLGFYYLQLESSNSDQIQKMPL